VEPRSLEFITAACAGELHGGSPQATVRRVHSDTRGLQPGDLFVALRGERFDGHDFLSDAAQRGAVGAIVEPTRAWVPPAGLALILVSDTRRALGALAARYRADFDPPVIAIAGSNGKTTTKALVASVLAQQFPTLSSEASFNNDLGVPLTLLRLERSHRAAVLEVGTNHPGELAPLVRMIQPTHGVITSVGREHLEYFGDLRGVVEEEGVLADLLPAHGTLFLHGDSEWTLPLKARCSGALVTLGFGSANHWRIRGARVDAEGTAFEVEAPDLRFNGSYRLRLLGRHQALNALFALAIGAQLGVDAARARAALAACEPLKMRLQVWRGRGLVILNDAYNANADSMNAALQTLREFPCPSRRVAVLGDMAELGRHTADAHAEAGRHAAEAGVNLLVTVGRWAGQTAAAAREAGLTATIEFPDVHAAGAELSGLLQRDDVVLFKASRAAGLERLVRALCGTNGTGHG
jgi:UDP-N-acetylmuramoyl-tripeptide--D-alanyl-D-alanine ligase